MDLNEIAEDIILESKQDRLIGQTIGDRYQVIKVLGSGGMGRVYLVKHLQLDRFFALKLLNKGDFDKRDVDRFNEEAKTASGLHHPNVVAITDHASHEGAPYVVMEFAEGENLEQILEKGPIPQPVALEIFIQICEGLAYAHSKRVVHRDLKPSNIVVARQPNGKLQAKLVDFGIAKSLEANAANLTQNGMIVGTPGYMSPEQCTGNKLDHRSDIYSLGCVMFEALTGKPLFEGANNMQVIFKHINERPPLFKAVAPEGVQIKPELERVVMQALEKEPENRYQRCEDLEKDLALVLAGKNPVKETSQARKLSPDSVVCKQVDRVWCSGVVWYAVRA